MSPGDRTSMGGPGDRFETTDWASILRTRTPDDDERREAMGRMIAQYWKPIYCYLRRQGFGNEEAKDLAQGFFHEVVLGRELVQKADSAKGRFRSFLLVSLGHYVANVRRAGASPRRRPPGGVIPVEAIESFEIPDRGCDMTPEAAFNYEWAATLLEQVLEQVECDCRDRGQQTHWEVFRLRVVKPIMEDSEPPAITEVCAQAGVADLARASNMIVTVKRRFRAVLAQHVRRLVASEADVEAEMRELTAILSESGAGF